MYVDEGYGRVFFGGKQLFELDPTNTKYLSISKHDKRMKEELELKENLILITRSGTIGKTVLVPKHWENWVASEDVLRIAPASAEMAGKLLLSYCICFVAVLPMVIYHQMSRQMKYINMPMKCCAHR